MMNDRHANKNVIRDGLDALKEEGAIRSGDREMLADLAEATIDKKVGLRQTADELTEDLLAGKVSYDTFLARLRALGFYEADVAVKLPGHAATSLLESGILSMGPKGHKFSEPFWPFMYRLLDFPTHEAHRGSPLLSVGGKALTLISQAVSWIGDSIGIHKALENRYWLAHSVAARVGQEESLLFSNTPAVFNPWEFKKGVKNHTLRFTQMLQHASHRTVYVWNRDAIADLIRKQLKEVPGADHDCRVAKLKSEYCSHFSKYSSQPQLQFYWGDNALMTRPNASLQYISDKHLIVGARDLGGKMECGLDINRRRLQDISIGIAASLAAQIHPACSLLTIIAGPALADRVLGPQDFDECHRLLVLDAGYENLTGLPAYDVVERAFAYSLEKIA